MDSKSSKRVTTTPFTFKCISLVDFERKKPEFVNMIDYFLQRDYTFDKVIVSFQGIYQFINFKVHKYNRDKMKMWKVC